MLAVGMTTHLGILGKTASRTDCICLHRRLHRMSHAVDAVASLAVKVHMTQAEISHTTDYNYTGQSCMLCFFDPKFENAFL